MSVTVCLTAFTIVYYDVFCTVLPTFQMAIIRLPNVVSANRLQIMLLEIVFYTTISYVNAQKSDTAICFGNLTADLPVRYLHIQLLNNGRNVTESQGSLSVRTGGKCRLR